MAADPLLGQGGDYDSEASLAYCVLPVVIALGHLTLAFSLLSGWLGWPVFAVMLALAYMGVVSYRRRFERPGNPALCESTFWIALGLFWAVDVAPLMSAFGFDLKALGLDPIGTSFLGGACAIIGITRLAHSIKISRRQS